ncbi:MAG: hypothetical protein ACRCZY_06750 [Phocaeicola sp.]
MNYLIISFGWLWLSPVADRTSFHKVFCFFWISWGGKIAYNLAGHWYELKGQLPTVIMGDTYLIRW